MIDEIKVLLGDNINSFTETQIEVCAKWAIAEVEAYCNRTIAGDYELEIVAQNIAILKLNRIGSEGLLSQGYSGVSETYVDGYPASIQAILNRKRKIKVI